MLGPFFWWGWDITLFRSQQGQANLLAPFNKHRLLNFLKKLPEPDPAGLTVLERKGKTGAWLCSYKTASPFQFNPLPAGFTARVQKPGQSEVNPLAQVLLNACAPPRNNNCCKSLYGKSPDAS